MRWRKGKTFLVCLLGGTDMNDVERDREALSPKGVDTLPDYVDDPEDEEFQRDLLRNRAMFQLGVTGWENIKVVVKPMSDGKHWVAWVSSDLLTDNYDFGIPGLNVLLVGRNEKGDCLWHVAEEHSAMGCVGAVSMRKIRT